MSAARHDSFVTSAGVLPGVASPVITAHTGNNADLIAEVCRLYAPPGTVIADVTYGAGRFWRKQPAGVTVIGSDLYPGPEISFTCDFRQLPYRAGAIDIVVLDPPYVHNAGVAHSHRTDRYAASSSRYNGHLTTAGLYNGDILCLYRDGMTEARRVLRPAGGQLWVKCKDEVEREVQRWSHIKIYEIALRLGFSARDLFVLIPDGRQAQRWPGRTQRHARKNHSYLWIFERPDERYRKLLSRPAPGAAPLPSCRQCGKTLRAHTGSGRRPAYCSDACRQRAHRKRGKP